MDEPSPAASPISSEPPRWHDRALWLAVIVVIVTLLLLCVALVLAAAR
ncbi:MAG: hypothetical protein IT338_12480 [Thermomicrobiales bacterium]|nr:hypothetical protein [Thermomicrobiales bacterium]